MGRNASYRTRRAARRFREMAARRKGRTRRATANQPLRKTAMKLIELPFAIAERLEAIGKHEGITPRVTGLDSIGELEDGSGRTYIWLGLTPGNANTMCG